MRVGHDVTLFASAESRTRRAGAVRRAGAPARPAQVGPRRPSSRCSTGPRAGRRVRRHPLPRRLPALSVLRATSAARTVTTLHGRLDSPDLQPFYAALPPICRWSRSPTTSAGRCRRLNWVGTVHHGLPADLLPFTPTPGGGYLAFLGRISPEKRPDRAIEIASGRRHAAEDRRQGRPRRQRLLRATRSGRCSTSPLVEYHRRDRRRREGRVPRQRPGAAVPDRLAGAVRPGDDRGHGLRHAGHRLPPRLGARGDRGRRDAASSSTTSRRRSRRSARIATLDRRAVPRRFEQRFTAERMARGLRARCTERIASVDAERAADRAPAADAPRARLLD